MKKRTLYKVEEGFFSYVRCGSWVERREADSPECWEFRTEAEARELYDSLNPLASWRVVRDCSPGKRTSWAGGFRSLTVWEEEWDEEWEEWGDMEFVATIEYDIFEEDDEEDDE